MNQFHLCLTRQPRLIYRPWEIQIKTLSTQRCKIIIRLACVSCLLAPFGPWHKWLTSQREIRTSEQVSFYARRTDQTALRHLPLSEFTTQDTLRKSLNCFLEWAYFHLSSQKPNRNVTGMPTGWLDRMLHRKWRYTKQQLIWWLEVALLGLVCLHFLYDIL